MIVSASHAFHNFTNSFGAEQGTTETLSKFWMPLKEFTEKEVEGLKQGHLHIPIGQSAETYEKFNERGKIEQVKQIHQRMAQHRK